MFILYVNKQIMYESISDENKKKWHLDLNDVPFIFVLISKLILATKMHYRETQKRYYCVQTTMQRVIIVFFSDTSAVI